MGTCCAIIKSLRKPYELGISHVVFIYILTLKRKKQVEINYTNFLMSQSCVWTQTAPTPEHNSDHSGCAYWLAFASSEMVLFSPQWICNNQMWDNCWLFSFTWSNLTWRDYLNMDILLIRGFGKSCHPLVLNFQSCKTKELKCFLKCLTFLQHLWSSIYEPRLYCINLDW